MSFASKFNKGKKFDFDFTGLEFKSLSDLYNQNGAEKIYTIKAMYINTKSNYGDAPVFATPEFLVNAPQHMTETVNEILKDSDAIDDINNGKVGFSIYPYKAERFNVDTFGIKFEDIK